MFSDNDNVYLEYCGLNEDEEFLMELRNECEVTEDE